MSIRRLLLDPILMQAAVEAGAEVRMAAKVTAQVRDGDRVTGVRVARNGSEQALGARLVVGADGRNSTVARLAGSRSRSHLRRFPVLGHQARSPEALPGDPGGHARRPRDRNIDAGADFGGDVVLVPGYSGAGLCACL